MVKLAMPGILFILDLDLSTLEELAIFCVEEY